MGANLQWFRIAGDADEISFGPQDIAVVQCNNKQLCVARYKDQLYAFAYLCPHASGIMANGYLDPLGNVVCPTHRYKFSIQNGRNVSGEGYHLKTYPVESRADGIYIGMQKTNWLGF